MSHMTCDLKTNSSFCVDCRNGKVLVLVLRMEVSIPMLGVCSVVGINLRMQKYTVNHEILYKGELF